jgi:hypothetical protein
MGEALQVKDKKRDAYLGILSHGAESSKARTPANFAPN